MKAKSAALCGALLALSLGLAACRDGGSAGPAAAAPSTGAGSAGGAAAAASYAIVRVVKSEAPGAAAGSGATRSVLYIVDPAASADAVQTIDLGTTVAGAMPPFVGTAQDIRLDRATQRYTYNGESMAFFVKDGKVWKIELRADLPHTPQQVSSLDRACAISLEISALPVSVDGRDTWIKIATAGADGSCAMGRTGSVFVRSTMSASTAPLPELPGIYVDALDDGARGTLAFALVTPAGLELFGPDFQRIGKVEGGDGVRVAQGMGHEYAAPQAGFYRVDGTLRRMTWTAKGATLAAPTYTFTRPDFGTRNPVPHSDQSSFYFGDDHKLMKIAGAGQPVEIATIPGPPIYAISVSDTHLVLWQADPGKPRSEQAASAIAKTGGKVMTIDKVMPIGHTAHKMIYRGGKEVHAINFDGSGDVALGSLRGLGSLVGNRRWVADLFYTEGYVDCVPAADDPQCGNGRIEQVDVDSLARIDIGSLSHAGKHDAAAVSYGSHTMGILLPAAATVPTFLGYQSFARRGGGATDLYTWTPGTAGSLKRLTHQLP